VVIDVVVNHTSHEHEWFRAALDPDSPMRDRYIWSAPRAGRIGGEPGAEPTDWRAAFGGSAWTWHAASGEYYLSLFSRYQPDLNWEAPELRAAVAAMLRWWAGRGVDGFRLDVINLIDKPPLAGAGSGIHPGDEPPHTDAVSVAMNGPRVADYLHELRREVLGDRRDILLLGETPGVSVAQAAALTDPESGPLDLVFAFEHSELDREAARWRSRPFDLRELKRWAARWQTGEGASSWNALFLSSHDQPRIVSRYGDDTMPAGSGRAGAPGLWWARSATAWAAVLHAHRGTPFVYQGDEIAMTNFPFASIDEFVDIEAHGVYRDAVDAGSDPADVLDGLRRFSRDNARTPMQWDETPGAGFTSATPWLAINPNHAWLNVAAQAGRSGSPVFPGSPLAFTRALIALRHTEAALATGAVTVLLPDDAAVYAIERSSPGVRMLVIANLTGEARSWPRGLASDWTTADVLLSNLAAGAGGDDPAGATLEPGVLQPWEARILRRASAARR
jgi:oligo-1,6-glucosidase